MNSSISSIKNNLYNFISDFHIFFDILVANRFNWITMKKAFTMLELIFVIIVIGVLAAVIIPRTGSNKLHEGAVQVLSHIRYTQHLAMVDDKFDDNASWYEKRWQIHFENDTVDPGQKIYMIYSNKDGDANEDDDEYARDPLSKRLMRGANNSLVVPSDKYMSELMISREYGITNVTFDNTCHNAASPVTSNRIGFDFLGRPYFHIATASPYDDMITVNCDITLTSSEGTAAKIRVHPETGYACILNSAGTDCI